MSYLWAFLEFVVSFIFLCFIFCFLDRMVADQCDAGAGDAPLLRELDGMARNALKAQVRVLAYRTRCICMALSRVFFFSLTCS